MTSLAATRTAIGVDEMISALHRQALLGVV